MEKLLEELQKLNIKIKLIDGNIKILASNGKLSKEIIDKIKSEKNSLLEYLTNSKEKNNKILTPSDITYKKLSIVEVDELCEKFDLEDIYQLTPMQEGMLFHTIHDPDSSVYFEQMSYQLEAEISVEIMRNSLNELIKRYDVLRTIFVYKDLDVPLQIVLKNKECGFIYKDIRGLSTSEKEVYIENYKCKDRSQGFVLDQEPLMRVSLLQLEDNEFELIWSHHHIIMDGWCISLINNDFFEIYNSLKNNRVIDLPVITPYKEYLKWLDQIDKNDSLKYWEEYLYGYEDKASLPNLAIESRELKFVQETERIHFSRERSVMLQKIVEENNVTINTAVQCLWSIVLGRYCVKQDVVFGSIVSGRPSGIYGIEAMVGLFLNNIPVRISYLGDEGFNSLLKRVQSSNLDSESHHYISLAEIQSQSLLKQNLIDHIIVFENYPIAEKIETGNDIKDDKLNVKISGTDVFEQTNYNLTIIVSMGNILKVNFIYNSNVFDSKMMKRLKIHFENAFNQVIKNPKLKISNIEIISQEEKQQLLYEFNNTKADYPKDKTIHQLFEDQVEKTPENVALSLNGETMRYSELNARVNKLAWKLREQGVKNDSVVGLFVERSIEMVAGILGILKSGGAYLPIDTEYPKDRISYMFEDSKLQILLVNNDVSKLNLETEQYLIYDLRDENSYASDTSNLDVIRMPEDLIYVIYTSGSTGKPKGVMLEDRNMVNLIHFNYEKTNIDFSSILQFSTISFDASAHEIFGALLSGGKLVLVDEPTRLNVMGLFDLMTKESVKTVFWPMSFIKMIFGDQIFVEQIPKCLRHIQTAGEKVILNESLRNYLKTNNVFIHNHYGPSETHVVTTLTISPNDNHPELPSIGKPISNTSAYILDKSLKPVPIGVKGELYFGGTQVGRGYFGKEELTSEKFIESPFIKGEKIYQTGDVAKWTNVGDIEFLGRVDFQVKIRGFRIELGEIESVILKHENIKESLVLAIEENNDKYLCAYVVCKEEFNNDELRDYLSAQLPDYMIPSYFVELENFPLTANGKVNRNTLPLPEIKAGDDYVVPANEIELKLAAIWSEVLNIDIKEISVTINFFAIGGHSLKATVLTGYIHRELGVEFPLRDVFLYSTIRSQANQIETMDRKKFILIPKTPKQDFYSLSSGQKRLYLLQQMDLNSIVYNMPFVISLGEDSNKAKIEEVFQKLISRHESFRTSFDIIGMEPVQLIHEQVDFKVEKFSIERKERHNIQNKFTRSFDLSQAPLLRVVIVETKEGDDWLVIDLHHIISDGVSLEVLKKEFQSLYSGEELLPLKLQYKDYSDWQNNVDQQEKIKDQEAYWLKKFDRDLPILNLPTDYIRPLIQSHEGVTVNFVMSKEETEGLRFFTKENDLTLFMSLLSVFNILLSKLSGQDDIVVGTPIAGRNHADLENIVGVFINTLSIRNEVKGEETIREFVSRLKQTVLGAYENQNYQFEDLVDKVSVGRDTSRNPIFDVGISLLNQVDHNRDLLGTDNGNLTHTKGVSKFDLSLGAVDYGEQLLISFNYCTQLFKAETIERFIVYFKQIVGQLARKPEIKISAIEILTEEEKHQLLYEFNNTKADYPKEKTIHQLFEEQVEKVPDNIALCYEHQLISYKELNKRSNQIAHYLLEKGLKREDIVGIELDSSYRYVACTFAVLKSGGAFLPIDKKLPDLRKKYIVENSELKILIHNDISYEKNIPENVESINIEKLDVQNYPLTNPSLEINSSNLAYIIYTSGSTGNPKGTLLEHKGIVSENIFWKEGFKINSSDKCLQFANISFDASIAEIYSCLFNGASLYILDENIKKDISLFEEYLVENQITVATFPPPFADNLDENVFKNFRLVITAGSETNNKLIEKINKNAQYLNAYGPTETSICATCWDTSEYNKFGKIVIGRSIQNIEAYIIDSHLQLQGIGISGELCFSGVGLARGYLRNPELTAEKFILHPFKERELLYRTGDVARWLSDGNIEFLGRIDQQVKIRGFRIELGEIENVLLKHNDVKEVVVVVDQNESLEKTLIAYVCLRQDKNTLFLRAFLEKNLPYYMIPSFIVQLDELPLTHNGKIDKKALTKLKGRHLSNESNYMAPQNSIEERLVKIWEKLLSRSKIGINDNFFSVGGNSLSIIKLHKVLSQEFNVQLNVVDLFNNNTISLIADLIKSCQSKDESELHEEENFKNNIIKF